MTTNTFEAVLIYGLLLTWLIFSLVFLADAIQTLIYNHKSEKRDIRVRRPRTRISRTTYEIFR